MENSMTYKRSWHYQGVIDREAHHCHTAGNQYNHAHIAICGSGKAKWLDHKIPKDGGLNHVAKCDGDDACGNRGGHESLDQQCDPSDDMQTRVGYVATKKVKQKRVTSKDERKET